MPSDKDVACAAMSRLELPPTVDVAQLRAELSSLSDDKQRAECMASIQRDAVQLALDLLVTHPDLRGFFRMFIKRLVDDSGAHACGVWLLDESTNACDLWMANVGGETLFFWIQTGWILVVSMAGAVIWSLIDRRARLKPGTTASRRAPLYGAPFQWFRLFIRLALAAQLRSKLQQGLGAFFRPAAEGGVLHEFVLQFGARQGIAAAATQVGLVDLDHLAILQGRGQVAAVVLRIFVLRIDPIGDARGKLQNLAILYLLLGELRQSRKNGSTIKPVSTTPSAPSKNRPWMAPVT